MLANWVGGAGSPAWIRPTWSSDSSDRVRGLFSFRSHGTSPPPFTSLNVAFHVGDNPACVAENRKACAQVIGGSLDDWVVAAQIHSNGVAVVGRSDSGAGALDEHTAIPGVDALVTNDTGVTLALFTADCVPILMYDPVQRAIAAVHSGWRGTVDHVVVHAIEAMVRAYHSDPRDIEVWMGPAIRACCYEVDEKVAARVKGEHGSRHLRPAFSKPGHYYLGLQSCIRSDLVKVGVSTALIHDTGLCTSCRRDTLFSHRAEGGKTGRMLGAIRLSEEVL